MLLSSVVKLYETNAVSVCGLIGRGKDMLTANVIERRKLPHISNCTYNQLTIPLDLALLDCGKNSYKDFIENKLNKYEYPYFDGCDIYISDCGIYFPSQYCNELNKAYPHIPTFMALSRQLGNCHVHYNSQNLNRVWDKIREHADIYIRANWCKVFFKRIVIQSITIYDKYESCVNNVKPSRVKIPLIGSSEAVQSTKIYNDNFCNQHGTIKKRLLIYINRSKYDTRIFKELLKRGK